MVRLVRSWWFAALAAAVVLAPAVRLAAADYTDLTRIQSFDGARGWLNSSPLTPDGLRGRVVLVDFWEYTCVNCLKTLPYEKAWYDRYRPYGFVIVGVHSPEFQFSGDPQNVAQAVRRLGITWPVALDSDLLVWRRYRNQFWPHAYLVDERGRIVYDHVGEGDYPDTERRIQELIKLSHPRATLPSPMGYLPADSYAKPGAVCYPHTPETYVGAWRGDGALGNHDGYGTAGKAVVYSDADPHEDGRVYLRGAWLGLRGRQAMVHARADPSASDYIALRYHAIEVVAVLTPEAGKPVKALVEQDGRALAREDAGKDVRYDGAQSYVYVDAPREYDLVMNRQFGRHELKLRPFQSGLGVYAFDFESCEIGSGK